MTPEELKWWVEANQPPKDYAGMTEAEVKMRYHELYGDDDD